MRILAFRSTTALLLGVLLHSGALSSGAAPVPTKNPADQPYRTDYPGELPGKEQSFPAMAADGGGTLWVAVVERPAGKPPALTVHRLKGGRPDGDALRISPEGCTGIGAPAIARMGDGCLVAFPVELKDQWRIAYVTTERPDRLSFIECAGNANIQPAAARAGDGTWVVWESNADGDRSIRASRITASGASVPVRISAENINSYNPSIVARANADLMAAWDSLREENVDLYGAELHDGQWRAERRLTSDPRIERHPALAAWKDDVWMAWQAQSYPGIRVNDVTEQRIVVARLAGADLQAPKGWFDQVSTTNVALVHPRLVFDSDGRLWISARHSNGIHAGWAAMIWSYDGTSLDGPQKLAAGQGRWNGVPLVPTASGVFAAVQHDNLVSAWKEQGIHPGWASDVVVMRVPPAVGKVPEGGLATEPLRMPRTKFSLAARRELINVSLPRQTMEQGGRKLSLYWGSLHDHTDLSVCNRRGNPPGHDLFANERDLERLDFIALTDHGYNFDEPQWAYNGEQTRNNHDPGRFVTFLGQEWTSSKNPPKDPGQPVGPGNAMRYGHHNIIFLDPHHLRFYDSYDGNISPAMLWQQLEGTEFICIPHELADWKGRGGGNPPTDWSFHDEHLQPVAEIFQTRQSYEYFGAPRQAPEGAPFAGKYYLQDAWAMGIIIGTIASPDHGGGLGKAGVWAKDLTREALFKAIRARHTFGTSGAKMSLLLTAGDAMMGDQVARPAGPIAFRVKALAARDIKELVIFRNNQIVHRVEPGRKELDVEWTDTPPADGKALWYYARIHAVDNELAWTSPIWFQPAAKP